MLDFMAKAWEKNQDILREAYRDIAILSGDCYYEGLTYEDILYFIIHFLLNGGDGRNGEWDEERIHCIDDGSYQGTLLFLAARKGYEPAASDYFITAVGYGSCSGCDTLMAANELDDCVEKRVDTYMMLSLHMIQRAKMPFDAEIEWEGESW